MPLREYRCPDGHITDQYIRGEYPPTHPCKTCGGEAVYTIAATARGKVTGSDNPVRQDVRARDDAFRVVSETDTLIVREKGSAPLPVTWVCADGHEHMDLYNGDVPKDGPACVTCEKPTKRKVELPMMDHFTASGHHASGGYYCNGLGRWVRSPEHRRQLMREMQVQEGGDDRSELLRAAEKKARDDASDRRIFEMLTDPAVNTPDVKKAEADGRIQSNDWAVDALRQQHPDW